MCQDKHGREPMEALVPKDVEDCLGQRSILCFCVGSFVLNIFLDVSFFVSEMFFGIFLATLTPFLV